MHTKVVITAESDDQGAGSMHRVTRGNILQLLAAKRLGGFAEYSICTPMVSRTRHTLTVLYNPAGRAGYEHHTAAAVASS